MLSRYLLEEPIPLVVVAGCLAFALLLTGQRRRQRGFIIAAGFVAAIGATVYGTAEWITTDREIVEQRMRQLVYATSPMNTVQLRELIDPRATFTGPSGAVWMLPQPIVETLETAAKRFNIAQQTIKYLASQLTRADTATGLLGVRTTFVGEAYRPVNTEWVLTWRKQTDGQWRISNVQWIRFQGQRPPRALWR